MLKRLSVILLVLVSCWIDAGAQKSGYQLFTNILVDSKTSVITCFSQDEQGMLWIGTDKGLYSYDGFSSLSHFKNGNSPDFWLYCMEVVDGRYIYIGADNGVYVYDVQQDEYIDPGVEFPTDIRALLYLKGKLWIGTLQGLYLYDVDSHTLERVDQEKNPGIPHHTVYSIISTAGGDVYIGTYNGLCRYNSQTKQFSRVNLPGFENDRNLFVNSLQEDLRRNCIWIGTEASLLKYTPSTGAVKQVENIRENSIKSLALDSNGTLLAGTDNGLFTIGESGVKNILHDSRNVRSLSNNVIWSIFRDRDNNLWLGSNSGISLVHSENIFSNHPLYQITGTGDGNQIYSILSDPKGYYWLGGNNGIMRYRLDNEDVYDLIWYKIDNKAYPLPHNRIRHIYRDNDGDLWIATDGSINRYDYLTKQFVTYHITDVEKKLNSNWAYNIFEDEQRRIWVATCLGGIFVIDKDRLVNSPSHTAVADYNIGLKDGLSGMFINQLVPDGKGNLWTLIYNSGLDCIDMKTFTVEHFDTDEYTKGLKLNFLMRGADGNFWASFRGGVLCINPVDRSVKVVDLMKFANEEIFCMQDVNNEIWVSTSGGLVVIDKENLRISRIKSTSKNFTSMFFDESLDDVILGYTDGFSITPAKNPGSEVKDQPVVVTALYVNGERRVTGVSAKSERQAKREASAKGERQAKREASAKSERQAKGERKGRDAQAAKSLRYSDEIRLNYKENNISIAVSDFTYPQEPTNEYVYRINDLDDNWNILQQNSNRISYNNLKPGKYTLAIAGLDAKGDPSDVIKELRIVITPPVYLSLWAKIFYFLLIASLVVWIINFFRMRSILRVERKEKETILQQTHEKIELFTNFSHDLKTPLSLIIGPVSHRIAETSNLQEKKILEGILRNSMKLNSQIHQVLDFNKIDSDSNPLLILSHTEFVSFAKRVSSSYLELAAEKNIAFTFDTNVNSLYLDIDIIKWESILDNLLSNAFKYTPEGKAITLSLNYDAATNFLTVSLRDNGVGIPSKDLPHVFQKYFQSSKTKDKKDGTGIGLYLVKQYSELHGAKVDVQSTEDEGTLVTIRIAVKPEDVIVDGQESKNQSSRMRPLILIVDDNVEILDFIEGLLSSKYDCVRATSGSDGVKEAFSVVPDLIITDLMMPGMNGIDMCLAIRKNVPTSTIPVILLTAKNDKITELESIRSNIDAYITKPFESEILTSRVEQLLTSRQVQQTMTRIETISQPKEIAAVSFDEKFLAEVTQIVEDHISDSDFNVNALCELSSTSNKQVYRKIKQLTGQTPVEYIKSIRLKKAVMLLDQKKFSVSEVMYMVGFSSSSYFSKCFQEEYGKTPKQYAEKA